MSSKKCLLDKTLVLLLLFSAVSFPAAAGSTTFTYTGSSQTYEVPSGVDQIRIAAWGAQGGKNGGKGGNVNGTLSVSPGQTLEINVGGSGENGGWNGGGNGPSASICVSYNECASADAGNGGGASDVRINDYDLADRVIVAGGGGGDGDADHYDEDVYDGRGDSKSGGGGAGGEFTAGPGSSAEVCSYYCHKAEGGTGGTQSGGGAAGDECSDYDEDGTYQSDECSTDGKSGSLGSGGNGVTETAKNDNDDGDNEEAAAAASGGAGGGYYGGGSGAALALSSGNAASGGGAGGSNFLDSSLSSTKSAAGVNPGNGKIIIYTPPKAPSGLSAEESGKSEISLSWTDESSDEDSFNIYRSTSSGVTTSDTLVASVSPNTESYKDSSVSDGEKYYYIVTAENEAGESDPSNEASANLNDAPYPPSDPQPVNISFVEAGSLDISAVYSDPDNKGSLTFYESDGTEIDSCTGLSNNSRCTVNFGKDRKVHGENWWYAVAEDKKGRTTEGPSWVFVNNSAPYKLQEPVNPVSPADSTTVYEDKIDLEVRSADPDGERMQLEFFTNTSGNVKTVEASNSSSVSATFDTTPGETYIWWVKQSDGVNKATGLWNITKSQEWSFHRNDNPVITNVTPEDGEAVEEEDVELKVEAKDSEGDPMTAYFLNEEDELIGGEDSKIKLGADKKAEFTWENREIGESYTWRVKVGDGHINTSTGYLSFRKLSTISYRTEQTIDYRYSSIIISSSSTRDIFINVENRVSDQKQLRTYLSGINAEFLDGSKTKTYTLPGDSSRRIQVRLKPESAGSKQLKITTVNTEIGINTSSTIPVLVRDYPAVADSSQVPGIGFLQIIMLVLMSAGLYFAQL